MEAEEEAEMVVAVVAVGLTRVETMEKAAEEGEARRMEGR